MVQGRLNRESNPLSPDEVGFTPQHDSTGNEDFVNTSPLNPLPTAIYVENSSGIWVPQKATDDGYSKVSVKREAVAEAWEGTTNETKTFTSSMTSFSIINDSNSDITFTINAITITVKPNEVFDDQFKPFTEVQVTTSGSYRALVRG